MLSSIVRPFLLPAWDSGNQPRHLATSLSLAASILVKTLPMLLVTEMHLLLSSSMLSLRLCSNEVISSFQAGGVHSVCCSR